MTKRVLFIYNYGYPDDNVSAVHFTDFAEGIAELGAQVEFWCGDLGYRNVSDRYEKSETHNGVNYSRITNIYVKSIYLRKLLNLVWFNLNVFFRLVLLRRARKFDYIITGTDPVFNFITVTFALLFSKKSIKHFHWSLDLYPEALTSARLLSDKSPIYRLLFAIAGLSYRRMHLVLTLGDCMSRRLKKHRVEKLLDFYPWSLVEDEAFEIDRDTINQFRLQNGYEDKTVVLFSGNFGSAHDCDGIYEFLTEFKTHKDLLLVVSIGGNQSAKIYDFLKKDSIPFLKQDFVPLEQLPLHLSAVDAHVAIISDEWSGVVVPSKFFGSLHAGKPTIYIGPNETLLSNWIEEYEVGWNYLSSPKEVMNELMLVTEIEKNKIRDRCKSLYNLKVTKNSQIYELYNGLMLSEN